MKSFRFYLALWSGKAAQCVLKLLHRNGTYAAGKLALKLCPGFLGEIGRPELLIGVTGTNGKTTVSNMLCDIFEGWGESVVSNRLGSNINAGCATSLLVAADLLGRCRRRLGVLEMDERSARHLLPVLKPDWLLVTNLFRDSMRRNAHPEYIASLLSANLHRQTHLILNADDPISSGIAPLNRRTFFGMDPLPFEPPCRDNIVQDVRICPVCGEPASYTFRRYHHIGRASCPNCGWHSPNGDFQLISADPAQHSMAIQETDIWHEYAFPSAEIYNLYNALSVVTLLRSMAYPPEQIQKAMASLQVVQSRLSDRRLGRWTLRQSMAKGLNAVACSRNFDMVRNSPGRKAVVLMLDDVFDEKSSSENIAWLYDADFELLNDEEIVQILAVGIRSADLRLRLLLAGVEAGRILTVPKASDAAALVDLEHCEHVHLLFEVYRQKQADQVCQAIGERMERK